LYQVLLNPVSNAVKFTQQGEAVVEICRLQRWDDIPPGHRPNYVTKGGPPPAASSYLLVRVRDTGIGIPPEVLPSLFQAYVQANAHVQRKYGGTGLGLAISKKIIESLGGSIWVESVPAQGTTFSFCWPSRRVDGHSPAREPAVEAGRSANHRQATPGQAEKILIIENGTANRAYLQAEVQRMQFAPMAYANPQEALAWLARNQVRAAIIDDRVNDPDGVARQIRQISGNALLPLILLTPINAERSQLADIPPPSRRIYKPIKLEAIQQSLNQLIRQEPSVPTQPVPRPAPAVTPKLGESYPTQILLADDNPINLQVGLNLLRRIGCSADTASDGQEVLNTLSQKRYDILLLDIQMPLMDGFAVAQRIRQQEREAKQAGNGEPKFPLVIIAITANVMRGDSERMMAVGMNDYLAKPVDSRAFDTTLTRWIRHVHMARSMVNTRGVQPRAEEALHSMPGTTANGACAHPNTLERGADREPPVNLTQFRKIAGTSEAEVRSLRELFLDRTSDLMRQLKQALADGNTGEAKRLAHKGSGSSGTCGMPPLAGLLRDTERLSEAGQLADARLAFESAQCEFEQVREFLQKVI
ncbi:MAG: response regulator, partial [Verrucomicrobiota bacterium]